MFLYLFCYFTLSKRACSSGEGMVSYELMDYSRFGRSVEGDFSTFLVDQQSHVSLL